MPIGTDAFQLDLLASDPVTPTEGLMWYNTTASALRVFRNGQTLDVRSKKDTISTVAPGTGNDSTQGYEIGSRWLNTAGSTEYVCLSNTAAAAVWLAGSGGGGATPAGANGDVQFKGAGSTLAAETAVGYSFNYQSNTHSLTVGPTGTNLTNNPFSANGTVNSYVQSNVQNTSNGTSASSDLIATADNGNDNTRYVDFGINSSGYTDATFTITGANDGYAYCAGGHMAVGTDSAKDVIFFTNGTLAANERARITSAGNFLMARAALATTATDGFIYLGACAGIPTGVPSTFAGRIPLVVDSTNNVLYFYSGGAWKSLDPSLDLIDYKNSVAAGTTAALAANTRTGNVLTASANGALAAQDGVTLTLGQRLLVKNEVTGANNGLYTVTDVGAANRPWTLTRSVDMDASYKFSSGMSVLITGGTTQAGDDWYLTTADPITLNTTALTFTLWQPKAKYTEVNAAGDITTTSATDVVVTTMTRTPGQGTYLVNFTCDVVQSVATNSTFISVYVNGVQTANSQRQIGVAGATTRTAVGMTAIVTAAAGQAVDIRWRASAGTSTMGNRSLSLVKVA